MKLTDCIAVLLGLCLLSACSPATSHVPTQPDAPTLLATDQQPKATEALLPTPAASPTLAEASSSAQQAETPAASATPDLRPLPADWQSWPYVPTLSARALEIYQHGLSNGNDPRAFSVVGDCQSIPGVFMGNYDNPYGYPMDMQYDYLRETVDWYQGSFGREGMAVRGGFTAATILSPLQADAQICKPGETPLTCEFRVHNPSVLVVSLETWGDPKTVERYEFYLRQIIEKSIERGVLPILGTKADVAEVGQGRHVINPIIAKLAYEYDLPLWNFWRAAQSLTNHGIDPKRDGFHLTQEGWNLKSFVALEALDAVRRAAQGQPSAAQAQPSATVRPSPSPSPMPTPAPICEGEPDCAVFGMLASRDGVLVYQGVYWLNLKTQQTVQIAPEGFNLQDVLPDRSRLLLNHDQQLYLADGNGQALTLVSETFFDSSPQTAYFMKGGQSLAWISLEDGQTRLEVYDLASGKTRGLTQAGENPMRLYPAPDLDGIYWEKGICSARGECGAEGLWRTSLAEGTSQEMQGVLSPTFAPDGQHFAFMDPAYYNAEYRYNDKLILEDLKLRLPSRRLFTFPAAEGYKVRNRLYQYVFSPDSRNLAALVDNHSSYFEKSTGYFPYIISLDTGMILDFPALKGVMPQLYWAGDGTRLLLTQTLSQPNAGYQVDLQVVDLRTKQISTVAAQPALNGGDYRYITNLYWPGLQP